MAQLPPKIPTMTPNWPPFLHQTISKCTTAAAAAVENQNPSWDDFLDFSSSKRGVHRRSISDSIAFLETNTMPFVEECHQNDNKKSNYPNGLMSENLGFERLDDEQLMSMFADEMSSLSLPPTTSNPSTPSDQNSNNDEKTLTVLDQQQQQQQVTKSEPGEVESSCKQEQFSSNYYSNGDPVITDPKRVKRILANRQSAQRSRVRKLQYISELERSVTTLQTEVSALSPRVAYLDHQRLILNVDNGALKQRIAALAQDKIFKDAHQEALKKEIERLRQVYHQQQSINKMNTMHHKEQKQELLLS
ncbi:basic leucine zipper 34-like isoform X2 [Euphorbia lathyris]|uniref:basic leucine zipper 34-like isoform X2 n=1 Tax=Euphorbia lathyris TaxID=212925 RepID=UPI003313C9AF